MLAIIYNYALFITKTVSLNTSLVTAIPYSLAAEKLIELTCIIKVTHTANVACGFNEWIED